MPILPFLPLIATGVGAIASLIGQGSANNQQDEIMEYNLTMAQIEADNNNAMTNKSNFSLSAEWNALISDPMSYIQAKPVYAFAMGFGIYKLFPKVKRMLKRL